MTLPDPRRALAEPLRRTLDALVLRWLSIYLLAASVVIGPALCDLDPPLQDLTHAVLPVFLVGFIVFHLLHRRTHRPDGWRRAFEEDPSNARFALTVALAAGVGVLAALIAIFCPHGDPMTLTVALGIWLPIMGPLYGVAFWLGVDCSLTQLGRSADDADRAFRSYWRRVSQSAGGHERRG